MQIIGAGMSRTRTIPIDSVVDPIRTARPFGVDLCVGVRTDGRLDRDKLTAFIDAVRAGDLELNNEQDQHVI